VSEVEGGKERENEDEEGEKKKREREKGKIPRQAPLSYGNIGTLSRRPRKKKVHFSLLRQRRRQ
jgi:hypothetical protein